MKTTRVGIIGTGFIARGLLWAIEAQPDMQASCVLTRRDLNDFPSSEVHTNSVNELLDKSDLVVDCAGDPNYGTDVLAKVLDSSIPVVTMDAELQITSGTYLSTRGILTEAEGDQPGSLAALHREAVAMGFKPLAYGNLKGFLNHTPTPEEMDHWAKIQGISLDQVTAFTDGTKVQVEQVLVANGLGATIARQGLCGYVTEDVEEGSQYLASVAREMGSPISDYLLCPRDAKKKFPAGIFITAEIDPRQQSALKYLKMGDGPYYTLLRNYHLCHLEIVKTIRHIARGGDVLLDNSQRPTASVAAIAKTRLNPGERIKQALGSFKVRGEAVVIKTMPDHLPIGLMRDVVIRHSVEPGQVVTFDDVEIPETLAYQAWQFLLDGLK